MSAWFDCADETQRAAGLAAATTAVLAGELVVLPTGVDEASNSSGAPEHAFDTDAPRFDRCPS